MSWHSNAINMGKQADIEIETASIELKENPFRNPAALAKWRGIYELCSYEGLAYFDPDLEWTEEEEKRLVRTLDVRIFGWVFILFCSLDLIRRNINRVTADNFLQDLGLGTNDYNLGQTLYLVSFLSAELPGNLLSKRFGCEVVIPCQMIAWSVLCIFQGCMVNKAGFLVLRVLIGMSQGGFIPDTILYLTYFYNSRELPLRLAIFWTAIPLFQILGSLLAAGLLEMRGLHNLAGWRYLFIIEGILSLVVALLSFYCMRQGPTDTGNKLFKRGPWFNEREKKILVNRILRDDPAKGDMNNRQPVTIKEIFLTLGDYDLWPILIQGITAFIPFQPVTNYITLILREMGYSTFMSNILAIPGQAWFLVNLPLLVLLSRYVKEKSICVGISNIFILPFIIALVVLPNDTNNWVKYVLLTGILSQPYAHAILAAWVSQSANSVRARAVGTSLYNMSYQVGSIIATQIYRNDDKPYYDRGNKAILAICIFNILFAFATKAYYVLRNKYKDKKWTQMSESEQRAYLEDPTHKGMKQLNFKFTH